jgi:hypothetical protein
MEDGSRRAASLVSTHSNATGSRCALAGRTISGRGGPTPTSTARFGLPIPALEVALRDEHIGRHVRTVIVEPLEDPVSAADPVKQPAASRRRKARA